MFEAVRAARWWRAFEASGMVNCKKGKMQQTFLDRWAQNRNDVGRVWYKEEGKTSTVWCVCFREITQHVQSGPPSRLSSPHSSDHETTLAEEPQSLFEPLLREVLRVPDLEILENHKTKIFIYLNNIKTVLDRRPALEIVSHLAINTKNLHV